MKTSSGHHSYLLTPSYTFYQPTPFPRLQHRLFPPRHAQTLEHTLLATCVSLLRLMYVLFLVAPVHISAALVSHAVWPKHAWVEKGYGRGTFPTRLPGWGIGQTVLIPLIGSIFWALVYGTPRGMGWEEETTVPAASRWLFGRGHEGWCIEAEMVTLPPLPTTSSTPHKPYHLTKGLDSDNATQESQLRKRGATSNGITNGTTDTGETFVERAAELSNHMSSEPAPAASPYDPKSEDVPVGILRGEVKGDKVGVRPVPVAAFWQWKSIASAVAHGQVIAVKPGNNLSGIGSGPAISAHERMVLFFVGGGYHSGHAPQGPLSWTVCRQTSLRVLGVNFRKATRNDRAFPAALQDALAAWVYVTKRLGFRAENVILLGDSAGGGLALSLQLYLSALEWSGSGIGRARKLVLHSPMTDLTLGTANFTANAAVDIISPYMCSLARDNYLRHVIPVAGRTNPATDSKSYGESRADKVAARYDIDPYTLTPEQEQSEHYREQLARLAAELPETITQLGAFHPLFSPGLDASKHKYLAQALLLLRPTPSHAHEGNLEVLVTAGTAEIFYDQIKQLTRNLLALNHASERSPILGEEGRDQKEGNKASDRVKVSLIEGADWHHVFAYMNFPGGVKAQVDEVAKTFMLA